MNCEDHDEWFREFSGAGSSSPGGAGSGSDQSRQRVGTTGSRRRPDNEPVTNAYFEETMRESLSRVARVTAAHVERIDGKIMPQSDIQQFKTETRAELEDSNKRIDEGASAANARSDKPAEEEISKLKKEVGELKAATQEATRALRGQPLEDRCDLWAIMVFWVGMLTLRRSWRG